MAPGMAGVSLVRFQGSSGWDGSGGWLVALLGDAGDDADGLSTSASSSGSCGYT